VRPSGETPSHLSGKHLIFPAGFRVQDADSQTVRSDCHANSLINDDLRKGSAMKRHGKLPIAIVVAVLAVLRGAGVYAQEKFSLLAPSGIAFSDFRAYEDSSVVSSARTEECSRSSSPIRPLSTRTRQAFRATARMAL
jgi:hypothetical protein